jgi:peptidoglycan/xylan/chitin deacetylase (PgdA/CDA1 family)
MMPLTLSLKRLLARAISWTRLHKAVGRLVKGRCITIISYHNPDPCVFETHVAFLVKHYSFISLDELARFLQRRDWGDLPPKPMVLTIDDGNADNRRLAETIRKYRIPATIYLTAGVVGTNRRFWFNSDGLSTAEWAKLVNLPDSERQMLLEKRYGHTDTREYENRSALSWEHVKEWINAGGQIGGHSMFHPILTKCSKNKAIEEITQCKIVIDRALGANVRHFAYPNGDRDEEIACMVRRAGYQTARTTRHGWVTLDSDPFSLPVMGVADDADLNKMILQVTGVWHSIRTGRFPSFR